MASRKKAASPRARKTNEPFDFLRAAQAIVKTEEIDVPELGVKVIARCLSAGQTDRYLRQCVRDGMTLGTPGAVDTERLTRMITAASLIYEDGSPVIPLDRLDEIDGLPGAIWTRFRLAVERVNGDVPGGAEPGN